MIEQDQFTYLKS